MSDSQQTPPTKLSHRQEVMVQDALENVDLEGFDIDAAAADVASLVSGTKRGRPPGGRNRGGRLSRGSRGGPHQGRVTRDNSPVKTTMPPPATPRTVESLVPSYPPEIPTAETISQQALDELSMTSSKYQHEVEEMREQHLLMTERMKALEEENQQRKVDQNRLATLIEQMRSQIESAKEPDTIKSRGTASIKPAKEILASSPSTASAGKATGMEPPRLIPTEPQAVSNPPVDAGGPPKIRKKRNISD